MRFVRARLWLLIAAQVACVAGVGLCLGFSLDAWRGALIGLGAVGVGAASGWSAARAFHPAGRDGYAQGVAEGVLVKIALYEAAVFPFTENGVSDQELAARRTIAYRFAAMDGLPRAVRLSAASALEALDDGLDAERAKAAMRQLSLTVFDSRHA